MTILPLHTYILLKPEPPPDTTATGLHLPESLQGPLARGEIVATGADCDGPIGIGSTVLFPRNAGVKITRADGTRLMLIKEAELLAYELN